jgi:hypothetical protein
MFLGWLLSLTLSSLVPREEREPDAAFARAAHRAEGARCSGGFLPVPAGLERLGKTRKEFDRREKARRAERAGASESLGWGEGERPEHPPSCSRHETHHAFSLTHSSPAGRGGQLLLAQNEQVKRGVSPCEARCIMGRSIMPLAEKQGASSHEAWCTARRSMMPRVAKHGDSCGEATCLVTRIT